MPAESGSVHEVAICYLKDMIDLLLSRGQTGALDLSQTLYSWH